MRKKDYEYLMEICRTHPYLVHAKNIISKHKAKKNSTKIPVLDIFAHKYLAYLKGNLGLTGSSRDVIEKRVTLLNDYYDFFARYDSSHAQKIDDIFSAQSKFRSTVLEEFLAILLYDAVGECLKGVPDPGVEIGSVKAYANLYFYSKNFAAFATEPSIGINVKDQDFAIYRNVKIRMDDGEPILTSVPVVAIECKTYVDKTMFEGAAATAEKLKAGNPYTMFGIVAETYEIDRSFIPAYSRVDQVYILRKGSRKGQVKPIDCDVVERLVEDITRHLTRPWVDVENKWTEDGLLI